MTRRDDHTWDPATGVGMSATFGAAARAVATNKGLIDEVEYFTQVVDNQRYGERRPRLR